MQLNGVGWQSVEPSLEHSLGSTEATGSWPQLANVICIMLIFLMLPCEQNMSSCSQKTRLNQEQGRILLTNSCRDAYKS